MTPKLMALLDYQLSLRTAEPPRHSFDRAAAKRGKSLLRTATGQYRTTPLRGLWQHAPYFHDRSAPDLLAVVNYYDQQFNLNLNPAQKGDLVEFLKSRHSE